MKINKIIPAFLLGMGISISGYAQQVSKQYYVPQAGTMVSLMTEEEANSITHLTLTGNINAEDFKHLRDEFNRLEVLDLSNADIKMYTGKNGTYPDKFYVYMGNFIPAYAFCKVENGQYHGKQTLKKIILSEKIRNIEDAAFKGCDQLEICQIRRKTAPNLLPEALADSITAVFIPLGSTDEYKNKNNWSSLAIIEGEPTNATYQIGLMGSLEEEILKSGKHPRDINFLTIEGKMDENDFRLIRDFMPNLVNVNLQQCNATHIPSFTFSQKKFLLRIQLPQNLKSIGERAFSNCTRLSGTIELPASVTSIDYGAFTDCDRLKHVKVNGKQLTSLGQDLFGKNGASKLIY